MSPLDKNGLIYLISLLKNLFASKKEVVWEKDSNGDYMLKEGDD